MNVQEEEEIERMIQAYYRAWVAAGGPMSRLGRNKRIERIAMRAAREAQRGT